MLNRLWLLLLFMSAAARADPVDAHYAAYAAGLNVLVLDAQMAVSPAGYRLRLAYHTAGAFGLFVHSNSDTLVQGTFAMGKAVPAWFVSSGVLRGEDRVTDIAYRDGEPVIRRLSPPNDREREPVPPEAQHGTIDTLSAMAQLIEQVNQTGRCDGSVQTFDGRRLSSLRSWTIGQEMLPRTNLSNYAGPALHCGFEGRQLGGFMLDEDRARLQLPQLGAAWFASVRPGEPMIPVRISFRTRWFGDATMFIAPR